MVTLADVRDDRNVAAIEPQTGAQHTPAGRFQHRHVHERIGEHLLRALRTAAVATFDASIIKINAFRVGHADAAADRAEDVRAQASRRRFAVDAGNRDNWYAP